MAALTQTRSRKKTSTGMKRPKDPLGKTQNKRSASTQHSKLKLNTQHFKKDLSASYNEFKEFEGRQYSGMKVGRSHNWNYDPGIWKETKITPDLWEINFEVIKRRKGHAPEGSGVPVGTQYHWYVMAHQDVKKLNANDYTTKLSGLKFKLAHKRAEK